MRIMKRSTNAVLLLLVPYLLEAQEVEDLTELSFAELLARKKILERGNSSEMGPAAMALVAPPPQEVTFKGLHKRARGKTFYEDDGEDDKGHVHKQKDEHKMQDILNTSIMALSYLAFGGYLLCMIASALREKRRRIMMAPGAPANSHIASLLQHYMAHRPTRPFIRFPAVTLHQGRKKRRRRSSQNGAPGEVEIEGSFVDVIDYVGILDRDGQ